MKRISLTQNQVAIIDDEDYKYLNQFKWHTRKNCNTYYAIRSGATQGGKRGTIYMHREILGLKKNDGKPTDHIDGNGLNNQRLNLRICTNQQNCFNQRLIGGSSSRFKGVRWHLRDKKWYAAIKINRKAAHLGLFQDEKQAALAYDKKAKELFGEFARLNFPIALAGPNIATMM